MINNRQNGRRRGRGGGGQRQGGGGGGQGQRDSGNRIDSRARGNANQLFEKYKNMARDAQMSGDRVNTEYYLQFADHYFRVLMDQRGRADEQNPQRRQPSHDFDPYDDGDDFGSDFAGEGEPIRMDEQARMSEGDVREHDGNGRDQRDMRSRDDRQREDRPRDDRQRDDRQREDRQRDDRTRADRPREDRQRRNGAGEEERFRATAPANDLDLPVEPPRSDAEANGEEAPRRRGRPRRARTEAEVEGVASSALDADRLPPSLGITDAAEGAVEGDAPKPRRRRARAGAAAEAVQPE